MSHRETMLPALPPPPQPAARYTGARFVGTVAMAIWLAAAVGIAFFVYDSWSLEKLQRYGPNFVSGLGVTLTLVGISVALGAVLSVPLAFGRMTKIKSISWIAYAYVYFFRGTPLITQLFLVYYGLGTFRPYLEAVGLWTFFRDAWFCAVLTFTLNTAAYQAEILRGAIESVPRGQHEGAAALGLPKKIAFLKIILPQALIVALRPYGNEIILMVKGSAIVAIVTVFDLMGETRRAFSRTYDFQMYLWAAIMYLMIVEVLRNVWAWIENRITRHLKR